MHLRATRLVVALLCGVTAAVPAARAQVSKLPSPQGGDYGNGAAASDVAGGVFSAGDEAVPIPALAYGIPTGYGADWRDVFAGAGFQHGLRGDRDFNDGAVFAGFGLGDERRLVGVELTLAVYDLIGETFQDGSVSVKVHRRLPAGFAAAVGVENLFIFGRTDGGRSVYAAASKRLPLRGLGARWLPSLTGTLGVGNGRFNSVQDVRAGRNELNLFGSLGVRLHRRVSLLATWNGQDLTLGFSIAPLPWPVVITPVLLDVTGHAGDGVRFALGIGAGFTIGDG